MNPIVAVVQDSPVAFDLEATLERVKIRIADACSAGAALVVFPEAFVGGYPKGGDFGARVGMRSDAGRARFQRYFDQAIEVPGPVTEHLCTLAREHGTNLVIGVIERERTTLYCSALIIGDDGRLLGLHRKVMPTAMERLIWGFGDGSTLPVVDTAAGRVGAAICWENYMPMLRMSLYRQGIELWCAPTVDDRDSWIPSMRHIAVEGRCFVLSACQFARRGDCPVEHEDDPEEIVIRGGSCIVDPFGDLLSGPLYGQRGVLTASIDPDQITRGKYDLDVAGHYARPDIFRLIVDTRSKPPVVEDDLDD